ncbi:MAG: urease accessory protein UreF [Burkholderiales bacterium]|nr:urease accessory protein UreF [Burkholderiales bacterium]
MSTTTATITDQSLLRLMRLASPALPVGGFSYSEGLEAAVDAGLVTTEEQAAAWLVDQLHLSLARADLAVIAQVLCDPARAEEADQWVRQTRETSELKLQAEQMGSSLGKLGLHPSLRDNRTYPVAFALAALGTGVREALVAFAFGWAENMMQAAIKSVPLGQSAGQRILDRLAHEIPAAVDHALSLEPHQKQSFAPMLAILSARHETQYSRLFRS